MGAGRKTQTISVDSRNPAPESGSLSARNLHKNYLGGVIFGCKNSTITECLSKQLFGLPAAHFSYVRNIGPGLPLFNFNYSDRKLHGIYESASHGQMNIDAYAWTDGGAERTDFPAQVRVRINVQCRPLDEMEFKKVIEDNYYTARHFWFELDHAQARRLMSLFKPIRPTHVPALISNNQTNNFPPLAASKWKEKKDKKVASSAYENKFAVLDWDSGTTDCGGSSDTSSRAIEDIDNKETLSDWAKLAEGDLDGPDPGVCSNFGVHESLDRQPVDQEDYKIVLLKLKSFWENSKLNSSSCCIGDGNNLCTQEDLHYHNEKSLDDSYTTLEKDEDIVPSKLYHGNIVSNSQPRAIPITEEHQMTQEYSDGKTNRKVGSVLNESCNFSKEETNPTLGYLCQEKDATSTHLCDGNAEVTKHMLEVIAELKMQIAKLEQQQVEYDKQIQHLSNLHKNSGRAIHLLSTRLRGLESKIGTSMLLDDHIDKFVEQYFVSDVIYLIGGYSGSAWLSTLDSFSPSLDILKPLQSMSYVRSFASAVTLNGVIYAIGGGDGNSWLDSVECYDREHDEWTSCPPLIQEKGSLGAATLNGKIYAIGGGNGLDCFSEVEMFDPSLGRWISWKSMLHKRFTATAAELNGVLYAVGGYDGHGYLKSAERFDPRCFSWTKIPDMSTRRGCHSMAILQEKLYVMGGYNGDKMVSSVEIYDPRANAWMAGEPMHNDRGYAAAAVLGDSLFVIGGVTDSADVIESIECYKGDGWDCSSLKAVGRRGYLTATVI